MSNIDKHAVQAVADLKAGYTLGHADVAILNELARIALASLEVEPVAYMYKDNLHADARFSLHTRFGNWSQEDINEYEITEIPLYTAPPAPVSVPDLTALDNLAGEMLNHAMNCERRVAVAYTHCAHRLAEEVRDLRAAMLQGAEPVTMAYKLPDDFDFDRFNDVVWLEAVASNPHMHSPTTSVIAMVALELHKRLETSNSPVIPDDIRRMDWLVSKTVDVREPMVYGSQSIFWSQTITDEEDEYHATKLREQIDAAMAAEQAAAPQQEVK